MIVNIIIAIVALGLDLIIAPYIIDIITALATSASSLHTFSDTENIFFIGMPYVVFFLVLFAFFKKITNVKNGGE